VEQTKVRTIIAQPLLPLLPLHAIRRTTAKE